MPDFEEMAKANKSNVKSPSSFFDKIDPLKYVVGKGVGFLITAAMNPIIAILVLVFNFYSIITQTKYNTWPFWALFIFGFIGVVGIHLIKPPQRKWNFVVKEKVPFAENIIGYFFALCLLCGMLLVMFFVMTNLSNLIDIIKSFLKF